jgi:hypothetical protein
MGKQLHRTHILYIGSCGMVGKKEEEVDKDELNIDISSFFKQYSILRPN